MILKKILKLFNMSGPKDWGPHGWKFIHYVTLGYPMKPTETDKIKYKNFFSSLSNVIPCELCANNYKKHLKEVPLTNTILKNRNNMMAWGIKMHNLVNMENGKKEISTKNGIKVIKSNNDTCNKEHFDNTKNRFSMLIYSGPIIIFGLLLLYQLYLIYLKKNNYLKN